MSSVGGVTSVNDAVLVAPGLAVVSKGTPLASSMAAFGAIVWTTPWAASSLSVSVTVVAPSVYSATVSTTSSGMSSASSPSGIVTA